ncbi:dethiobiotin synthase [Algibacillus agarilyticus]|uniref:dethiobiotin synthase n=1 Tax=Algibacillus agarilyticus TaxID=2234133 RepID=UPI000DD04F1F|nr:dethiobiotin synthase [Algibacillus agarilyticus]
MRKIFITGTDTDVGKTLVTASLLKLYKSTPLKVAGFKPIAAGCEPTENGLRNDDALQLQANSCQFFPYSLINPIAFEPPIAPHIAAKAINQSISFSCLDQALEQWSAASIDTLLVEGAGGWFLPIDEQGNTLAQWVKNHKMDVILVVGLKLGCLNHALMTECLIKNAGLNIVGWVANMGTSPMSYVDDNLAHLKAQIDAPLLGVIPTLTSKESASAYLNIEKIS